MKILNFFFLLGLLLSGTQVFSQHFEYVRRPLRQSACPNNPDSVLTDYASYNDQRTYYSYDALRRVVKEVTVDDVSGDTMAMKQNFFAPDNLSATPDSIFSNQGVSITATYNSDSLLVHDLWYREPSHSIIDSTSFDYSKSNDVWIGKSLLFFDPNHSGIDTIGWIQVWIKEQQVQREISETRYYDQSLSGVNYEYKHTTFNADTIISVTKDSTLSSWSTEFSFDSSYAITHHTGEYQITNTYHQSQSTYQVLQTEYSIDSARIDGMKSVSYVRDTVSNAFIKKSKIEDEYSGSQRTTIAYIGVNNEWKPAHKGVTTNFEGDCNGKNSSYSWSNGQWKREATTVYFYDGLTAGILKPEKSSCKLPNPFSASYPFSCESLITGEPYTLKVFDLTGKMILDQVFYANQTLDELNRLSENQLYYFVITNGSNLRVMTQKIYLQH